MQQEKRHDMPQMKRKPSKDHPWKRNPTGFTRTSKVKDSRALIPRRDRMGLGI